MYENSPSLPDFTRWPSFPFEGEMRVKPLKAPVEVEPPRSGEDAAECVACSTPDDAYIWVSERWRVRGMDRPTGLPMVLILECRSHLDLGDLPNLLAAELGVMTVRLERAIRSLDGVARVHVNRWGDGSAHLHMWFLARPYGRLQLRGTFLSLWDDILPAISEEQWRGNMALVAAWLAGFGGTAIAEPPHIHWESPSTIGDGRSDNTSAERANAVDANLSGSSTEHASAAKLSMGETRAGEIRPGEIRPGETWTGETRAGETHGQDPRDGEAHAGEADPAAARAAAGSAEAVSAPAGSTEPVSTEPGSAAPAADESPTRRWTGEEEDGGGWLPTQRGGAE